MKNEEVYTEVSKNIVFGTFWFKDMPVTREEYYKKNGWITRKTVFQETNEITDGILAPDSKYIFKDAVSDILLGGLVGKCGNCWEDLFGEDFLLNGKLSQKYTGSDDLDWNGELGHLSLLPPI